MKSSKLLINEPPLQVLPTLARHLDVNKAIILQQVQYWVSLSGHEIDGEYWIYNSYTEWSRQFPWLTARAVRWHIKGLEESGFLMSGEFNKDTRDNTKWYRINYEKLEQLLTDTSSGVSISDTHRPVKKRQVEVAKNDRPLPENTQEIPEIIPIDYRYVDLLIYIQCLPFWKRENVADMNWLNEFMADYPGLELTDIKACRDYHDGKGGKHHKGVWKNRLRNWIRNKNGRSHGTHRGDTGDDRREESISAAVRG